MGLSLLMEVNRYVPSTQNDNLVIFFQYIKKKVSERLLCSIVMQNIQIFYRGPVMFIVTCFLAQPRYINFLHEHRNKIIKQQLCGEELSSLLPLLQVDTFLMKIVYHQKEAGCIAANQAMPIEQARKKLYQALRYK